MVGVVYLHKTLSKMVHQLCEVNEDAEQIESSLSSFEVILIQVVLMRKVGPNENVL